MPRGVYIRTSYHKRRISEGAKRKYARMTKEELLKSILPWVDAAQKRWDQRTEQERTEYSRPWFEAGAIAAQKANPSSIEEKIWKELDKLGIKYETQVSICGGMFIVDIYISIWRLIIEINGTYWHNYELFPKAKIRDDAVEKWAIRNNYKIIWLWESEIRKDPKQALLNGLSQIGLEVF